VADDDETSRKPIRLSHITLAGVTQFTQGDWRLLYQARHARCMCVKTPSVPRTDDSTFRIRD